MATLGKVFRSAGDFLAALQKNSALGRNAHFQRNASGTELPTALLVGFRRWKTFMPTFLPGYNVVNLSFNAAIEIDIIERIGSHHSPHVFSWSYKAAPDLQLWCKRQGVPLTYVEDGFVRSFGLGADRSAPLSLVFDDKAMHFDRLRPSRLEELLQSHDFDADKDLGSLTRGLKRLMIARGLSKYNFHEAARKVADVAIKGKSRVLVLGQVEDDLSIRHGADRPISGNELVMLAADENPNAQIFYRPHPESLSFAKPHYSNPRLVSDMCQILGPEFAISDCLDNCDLVYTVTSLAGFEAAVRGKQVVTLGAPFYSGWGFTEDRLPVSRRSRSLTADQVLGAAYLMYPRFSGLPANARPGEVLQMLERFAAEI